MVTINANSLSCLHRLINYLYCHHTYTHSYKFMQVLGPAIIQTLLPLLHIPSPKLKLFALLMCFTQPIYSLFHVGSIPGQSPWDTTREKPICTTTKQSLYPTTKTQHSSKIKRKFFFPVLQILLHVSSFVI